MITKFLLRKIVPFILTFVVGSGLGSIGTYLITDDVDFNSENTQVTETKNKNNLTFKKNITSCNKYKKQLQSTNKALNKAKKTIRDLQQKLSSPSGNGSSSSSFGY